MTQDLNTNKITSKQPIPELIQLMLEFKKIIGINSFTKHDVKEQIHEINKKYNYKLPKNEHSLWEKVLYPKSKTKKDRRFPNRDLYYKIDGSNKPDYKFEDPYIEPIENVQHIKEQKEQPQSKPATIPNPLNDSLNKKYPKEKAKYEAEKNIHNHIQQLIEKEKAIHIDPELEDDTSNYRNELNTLVNFTKSDIIDLDKSKPDDIPERVLTFHDLLEKVIIRFKDTINEKDIEYTKLLLVQNKKYLKTNPKKINSIFENITKVDKSKIKPEYIKSLNNRIIESSFIRQTILNIYLNRAYNLFEKEQETWLKVEEYLTEDNNYFLYKSERIGEDAIYDYYIFENINKILIPINNRNEEFLLFMSSIFGITSSHGILKYCYEKLKTKIKNEGKLVTINIESYYNIDTNTLYLHNFRNQIYVIKPNYDIKLCDNGVDGILFKANFQNTEFSFIPEKIEDFENKPDLLDEYIFKYASIDDAVETTTLTREEQIKLFKAFYYQIDFSEIVIEHPIELSHGISGTGKTTTLQLLLWLRYGNNANVRGIPDTSREFGRLLASQKFIVIDNIDIKNKLSYDFKAELERASTGELLDESEMFHNKKLIYMKPIASIGLTSIDPTVIADRPTTANRVLPITYKSFGNNNISRGILKNIIEKNRNIILNYLFNRYSFILSKLEENKNIDKSIIRNADYGSFFLKINTNKNSSLDIDNINKIFSKLKRQQTETMKDPIVLTLALWIEGNSNTYTENSTFSETEIQNNGRKIKSKELYKELLKCSDELGIDFPKTLNVFTKTLEKLIKPLKDIYTIDETKPQNIKHYSFTKKAKFN